MAKLQFLKRLFIVVPFAYLWLRLIDNLRVEWSINPQYSYGWAVPLLCAGLVARRWHGAAEISQRDFGRQLPLAAFFFLAFLYLPIRLLEAATPEWRPIQWALACVAIGLTLCAVELNSGRGWLRQLVFPICFFLVAIPWPTLLEAPVIQTLSRANASIVVEVAGVLGVPAVQHGNLIEVSSGMVGIDEACSGIRSFQSSLMISLFLGEFYRLGVVRRLLLVPSAFLLAFSFNVCRTTFLTLIAAKQGVAAVAKYHDPAGLVILLGCIAGILGFSWLLKRKETAHPAPEPDKKTAPQLRFPRFALVLFVWLAAVETGVQLWYYVRESRGAKGPNWSMEFPIDNSSFQAVAILDTTSGLLRYDHGKEGEWTEADGATWHAFYFEWMPGRVSGYLAKRHTPEICFGATGRPLQAGPDLVLIKVHDVVLPVRQYLFGNPGDPIHVFHCRWEEGVDPGAYVRRESSRFNLFRGIWAGRGKNGQKVIELIVTGIDSPAQARAAAVRQLEGLVKVESPKAIAKRL